MTRLATLALSLTLALGLSLGISACGPATSGEAGLAPAATNDAVTHAIDSATFPLYFDEQKADEGLTLYFLDGAQDLPYIEASDCLTLLESLYEKPGFPVDFQMSVEGPVVTYSRYGERYDADIPMTLDFDDDNISFTDYNLFTMEPGQSTVLDLIGMNTYDEKGDPVLLEKVDAGALERLGDSVDIDLGEYGSTWCSGTSGT